MNFERNIDPKIAMGIGYAGLIERFDRLGQPYGFKKESIPKDPRFYHHESEVNEWIQHWYNSWGDLISLYKNKEGIIRVFSCPANGRTSWGECYLDWMEPTDKWKTNFDY